MAQIPSCYNDSWQCRCFCHQDDGSVLRCCFPSVGDGFCRWHHDSDGNQISYVSLKTVPPIQAAEKCELGGK
jgi:hypothetical protein